LTRPDLRKHPHPKITNQHFQRAAPTPA